jgi:hypothetical protein
MALVCMLQMVPAPPVTKMTLPSVDKQALATFLSLSLFLSSFLPLLGGSISEGIEDTN